ncbi:MAG: hypothetical protein KIT09_11465 [Bryobacteraceae bacterium]|nr:hypothetical protein [Bryobacteraceae bacterium]
MSPLEKVERELRRYEHPLVDFSARETPESGVELVIALKIDVPGVHTYYAPLHPRDIEQSQFTWNFQRYLYDCLHDYLVELFTRTPQSRDAAS